MYSGILGREYKLCFFLETREGVKINRLRKKVQQHDRTLNRWNEWSRLDRLLLLVMAG